MNVKRIATKNGFMIIREHIATTTHEWVYFKAQAVLAINGYDLMSDAESVDFIWALEASVPTKCGRCEDILLTKDFDVWVPITVWCRIKGTRAQQTTDEEVIRLLEESVIEVPNGVLAAIEGRGGMNHRTANVKVLSVARQAQPDQEYADFIVEEVEHDLEEAEQKPAESSAQANTPTSANQQ
jgi:hypothetical protein